MLRFLVVLLVLLPLPALAAPKVVATIAPLAGIAAAVMDGVGTPDLLIKNNASPHTYQLKPSDAGLLADADIILWVGEGMEVFLADKLPTLAPKATLLGLMDEGEGVLHLPVREGEAWESEGDMSLDEVDHHHDHSHDDPHAWLDPQNAIATAKRLAETLAAQDNANAARYRSNADVFAANTLRLDAEIKQLLAPVASKGFILFHDAYQYFEQRYKLNALGAITLSPDVPPSANRLAVLQKRIKDDGAVCVFAEPQFSTQVVSTLLQGTTARMGILNPDASDIPLSPALYAEYMRRLATGINTCLSVQ